MWPDWYAAALAWRRKLSCSGVVMGLLLLFCLGVSVWMRAREIKRADPYQQLSHHSCTAEYRAERLFLKEKPCQALLLRSTPMGNLLGVRPLRRFVDRCFYCFKLIGVKRQVFAE
jgi:hypothetical protein